MSANPGNTGGKFKSSSMKHLINILNVFLAIYASRAMGRFGVPLIFQWRKCLRARPGWWDFVQEAGKGGGKCLFPNQAPGVGTLYPSTHSTLSGGQSYPAGTPQPLLFHLLLTAKCCFAGKSMSLGVSWTWVRIPAYFLLLCDWGRVSYPLWISAVKYYPPLGFVVMIKRTDTCMQRAQQDWPTLCIWKVAITLIVIE